MLFDYEILKLIWWALIGVLLIGFAVTDGFDFGVGTMLPFVGRDDEERRIMINTVAPHWDGNQVWLITAGGAIFAAWPPVYATAFSGFYIAMVLALAALFFRPIGFDYRSKIDDPRWRNAWDWGLFFGCAVPPVIFGVAFGNLIQGVPFEMDELMRPHYQGSFFGLLNPYALLAGVLSLTMIINQGATWMMMKTEAGLYERARVVSSVASALVAVLFALAGVWTWMAIDGYAITAGLDIAGPANPTLKTVEISSGAWFENFNQYPLMWIAPIVGVVGAVLSALCALRRLNAMAFLFSSLTLAGIICTAAFTIFPFLMPSSLNPSHSLTLWDATSSHLTLNVMLWAAIIFVPIVLSYTIWCYAKMFGRIGKDFINKYRHSAY